MSRRWDIELTIIDEIIDKNERSSQEQKKKKMRGMGESEQSRRI